MTADTQTKSDIEQAAGAASPSETPSNGVFGSLNDEEKQQFTLASRQAATVEARIGRLEVQKAVLIQQHMSFQQSARDVVASAAKRLGVPTDQPFRLEGDRIVAEGLPPQ